MKHRKPGERVAGDHERKQNNIRSLMSEGLSLSEMRDPLAKLEGRKTSLSNISTRVLYLLENRLVSAEDVMEWKSVGSYTEANKIIDHYDLQ